MQLSGWGGCLGKAGVRRVNIWPFSPSRESHLEELDDGGVPAVGGGLDGGDALAVRALRVHPLVRCEWGGGTGEGGGRGGDEQAMGGREFWGGGGSGTPGEAITKIPFSQRVDTFH